MRTQAQMGQHASQGALALGAGVRAAALVLDGRAQDWGNGFLVFDSSRNCSSAFGRSLFLSHARGFPSGQRIGRLSGRVSTAPGRLFHPDASLSLLAGGRSRSDRCAFGRQTGVRAALVRPIYGRQSITPAAFISRRSSLAGNLGSSARALPHFLFQPSDHLARQSSDRSENHVEILSSTPVGVDAQHGPKGFRSVRTPFREVGNEFRG